MDLFNVVTEFRFDAGSAILESGRLEKAVDGISRAADHTAVAFQSMIAGLVGHIDILHGGLIGGLIKAIEVSDEFNLSASGFANIIQANMKNMTGDIDTFNERLATSKQIMGDIHKVATQFGLDETAMVETTKGLAAVLAPMGQAGKNFAPAIDLSRMAMKSAPTLGVQPQFMQQEMVNILTGKANQQDTLFRRLLSDTQTMRQFAQQGGTGFNALPAAKRVELLTKALNEFSKDTEVAEFNMRSLHNQMTLLKNLFVGFSSILKPIGDILLPLLQRGLMKLNAYLETTARGAVENMVKAFKPFFDNPERSMAGIMTLRKLPETVNTEKHILKIVGALKILEWILSVTPFKLNALTHSLHIFDEAIFPDKALKGFWTKLGESIMGEGSAGLAASLGSAISEIVGSVTKIFMILEIFTKGAQYAKLWDLEFIANHMIVLTSIFEKFSLGLQKFFLPITNGIDALARLVGWFLSFGWITDHLLTGLDNLGTELEFIADSVTAMSAVFAALGNVISYLVANIMELNFSGISKAGISEAFFGGFKQFLSENLLTQEMRGAYGLDARKETGKSVTNVGKIEMRLDFKENMQPDRVAFTIMDQIKKVAQNPTQGRGNTFSTHALTGGASR